MFCACRTLNSFWTKVFKAVSYIRGVTVDPDPVITIFGTTPSEEHYLTDECHSVSNTDGTEIYSYAVEVGNVCVCVCVRVDLREYERVHVFMMCAHGEHMNVFL